jgi:hypothetical protein
MTQSEVSVKALEWEHRSLGDFADTPFGSYWVGNAGKLYWARFNGTSLGFPSFSAPGEAKAAAQANYEARILSALTHPPAAQPPDDIREAFPQVRRALDLVIDLGQYTTVQNSPILMMAVEAARNAVEVLGAPSPTPPDDVAEGMVTDAMVGRAMDSLFGEYTSPGNDQTWVDPDWMTTKAAVRKALTAALAAAPASLHPEGVAETPLVDLTMRGRK